MFLVKLVRRLLHFALFVAIVGLLAAVFLGYMWYNTGIGHNLYDAFANGMPSNGILAPGSADWFNATIAKFNTPIATAALTYVIPAGFAVLFGIGVYAVLSILAYVLYRTIKKKRQKAKAATA